MPNALNFTLRACATAALATAVATHAALAQMQATAQTSAQTSAHAALAASATLEFDDARRIAGVRPVAVAKWTAVAGAAAAAAYGFIRNDEADDLFHALERACQASPAVCVRREPNGSYSDPTLEALYQDVLAHDRASRYALLASQVGIAAGVVLFLLDLRSDERPPDIPYEPRRFEVGPAARGGLRLGVRVAVGF
jgi:hypothetical protein